MALIDFFLCSLFIFNSKFWPNVRPLRTTLGIEGLNYNWVLFENRPALFFLTIHLFLPIKYIFLFRIKDTVSDLLSVLLNFIAMQL